MRWSELALELSSWAIPSARMKRGQVHVLALPDAARDVLANVPRID